MKTKHPMQPLVVDAHNVVRFKPNAIVLALLDSNTVLDLNKIATMDFSVEDRNQLAQLIGYSVSGWGDLSYCNKRQRAGADRLAARMVKS